MFSLIGSTIKYSLLVLVVLVLSHIVQIRGVSISRHVENAMDWVGGLNPQKSVMNGVNQVTHDVSGRLQAHHAENEKALDADIPVEDQKKLNHLIEKSQSKK